MLVGVVGHNWSWHIKVTVWLLRLAAEVGCIVLGSVELGSVVLGSVVLGVLPVLMRWLVVLIARLKVV